MLQMNLTELWTWTLYLVRWQDQPFCFFFYHKPLCWHSCCPNAVLKLKNVNIFHTILSVFERKEYLTYCSTPQGSVSVVLIRWQKGKFCFWCYVKFHISFVFYPYLNLKPTLAFTPLTPNHNLTLGLTSTTDVHTTGNTFLWGNNQHMIGSKYMFEAYHW